MPASGPMRAASAGRSGDDGFGFEHRRASSGRRAGWIWGVAALIVVAALVTGFVLWRTGAVGCGDRTSVAVASDPAMTGALRSVAQQASEDSCFDYQVSGVAGADVPGQLTSGADAPDLWVADSQIQARRVLTQVRRDLTMVSPSIATSPTVVVGKDVPELTSWVDVMKLQDLRTGSPIDTSTGDAPIVGALAEVNSGNLAEDELTSAMTVLAVQQNNARLENDSDGARLDLANTSDVPVVTTEQQYLLYSRTHPGTELAASVPADGTVMLDYPMVNTGSAANQDAAAEAGQTLLDKLSSEEGRAALAESGYRAPSGEPLPGDDGVGQVQMLTLDDPTQVDKAIRQWQVLGVPIRTLVVQDTSGSMAAPAGDTTRAGLLIDASMAGLKLFPNNASIGGWAFGIDKGGPDQDWKWMSPIRRLDANAAAGGTHREQLGRAVQRGLAPSQLGGGTGLYDTTLAAFREVQNTYDPNYSNSVIIMTDGQNEDPNSITLDQLLAELQRLEDPARPVLILTIGISEDADTDALKQIADATPGGSTYVAENPEDIQNVFVDAIRARVAAAGR
ncbi:substrate-binding domain-containing protein [Gordonia sp. PKS22-38]|uniref:Substrate-binding domain-containing protein n=1 Tax=Gordonia prachuapensis TaxID=3115651 RepID=A0ABU7MZB2_9ACTN|nr:substrate-binding domain-containing protein [Gordonia sp. PKS22-38]